MLYEQVDTAVIDGESLPWVPFTPYADKILLKYFKLDPIRGEWIVLMKVPLDMQLPRHHHTGTVMVYTIEGKWKYKEHDWVATPGSIVYETAASTRTTRTARRSTRSSSRMLKRSDKPTISIVDSRRADSSGRCTACR